LMLMRLPMPYGPPAQCPVATRSRSR
jgi:hypothetical protein